MTSDQPTSFPVSDDGVFEMDPQAALIEMTRTLITGHKCLIAAQRASAEATRLTSDAQREALLETAQRYEHTWTTESLPHILAGMRLAIEVYDSFGPGRTRVADPIDASLLNNKYFVWVNELGG
ncbi:hypothetical protein QN239_32440 [Mycolicibacterium sp. Y3]